MTPQARTTQPAASLTLIHYLDAEPDRIGADLDRAIGVALDAAAERVHAHRVPATTEPTREGVLLRAGVEILDGSELRVSGEPRLTKLEVVVPWPAATADHKPTVLAANRFAHVLAIEVAAAA